jgi:glyoxylate carboligase
MESKHAKQTPYFSTRAQECKNASQNLKHPKFKTKILRHQSTYEPLNEVSSDKVHYITKITPTQSQNLSCQLSVISCQQPLKKLITKN